MEEVIFIKKFRDIDLTDSFFDSLKDDYPTFEDWFKHKSDGDAEAYVQYNNGSLQAFLYLKDESDKILDDVTPTRPACRRLKVGTFKIDAHKTKLGERFIKKILDRGIVGNYDEIYVTIYAKHKGLVSLLNRYGFNVAGAKGDEQVLVKNLRHITGDILQDYPLVAPDKKRKFLLSIYPKYHTKLFPDSILRNEDRYELIKDVNYTNSIHKIYLCFMPGTADLQKGDLLAIYRTNDYLGPAKYRSVVTSICQVEEVKTKQDFANVLEFIKYANSYSIFEEKELADWFASKKDLIVIKMTYNIALTKRVTRGYLLDEVGIPSQIYWGFFQLSEAQFNSILTKGEINENLIIH